MISGRFRLLALAVLALGVALWLLSAAAQGADDRAGGDDPHIRKQFINEALPAYDKLTRRVFELRGSYVQATSQLFEPAGVWRIKIDYCFNGEAGVTKMTSRTIPDNGSFTTMGTNGVYRYTVVQDANTHHPHLDNFWSDAREYGDDAVMIRVADHILGTSLRDYLNGPEGTAVSFTPVHWRGKSLVRFDYLRKWKATGETTPGYVLLDPSLHWAIVYWRQNANWGFIDRTIQYRLDVPEIAFPEHVEEREVDKRGVVANVTTDDFDKPEECHTPASEFELSYYGLQPPAVKRNSSVWFIVVNAVVLLGVGGYVAYRRLKPRMAG